MSYKDWIGAATGATGQPQVPGGMRPENSGSDGLGHKLRLGDIAVAWQQQEGAGNGAGLPPAGDVPAGYDIDWPHRLAAANRYLLEEINMLNDRMKLAERGMAILATVAGDWNEAADVVRAWKEATT